MQDSLHNIQYTKDQRLASWILAGGVARTSGLRIHTTPLPAVRQDFQLVRQLGRFPAQFNPRPFDLFHQPSHAFLVGER